MTKQEKEITAANSQILTAIAAAMGQVQKLAKGERNKHDGYNFASIDDFLALVNPICAEHGLIPHMQETGREDFERVARGGNKSAWMRQSFEITLMHISGEVLPPVTRTVEVMRNGAQAYGSAQSYALKQFWRCILLIPTGDKDDADFQRTEEGTVTQQTKAPQGPSQEVIDAAIASLSSAQNLTVLREVWGAAPNAVQHVPQVLKAKNERKDALEEALKAQSETQPTDDLSGDEIPY